MKKSELRGSRDVFVFTLTQTLKNKAYIMFTIIMLVLAVASGPVLGLVMGGMEDVTEEQGDDAEGGEGEGDAESVEIKKIYWYDELGFGAMGFKPENAWPEEEKLPTIEKFTGDAEAYDALLEKIDTEEQDAVVAHLYYSPLGVVTIDVLYTGQEEEMEGKAFEVANLFESYFEEWKVTASQATEEQLAVLEIDLYTAVGFAQEDGQLTDERKVDGISEAKYWVIYGVLFITMMVNLVASTQVANEIATDKSSKVVEYLLTSVRPMALIVGKILSMLVAAIGQMVLLFAIFMVSNVVTAKLTGRETLVSLLPKDLWANVTPLNLILCIVFVVLGFIFFAVLAGMCGATVSRIEEIQEGLTLLTVTALVGVYLALMAATSMMGSATNFLAIFAILFPLSSPYIVPGGLLVGGVELLYAFCSLAILAVADVLLFLFVARIYEMLITHSGTKLKLKDLTGMYKNAKKGGKKA